jgi:hypothetical protein
MINYHVEVTAALETKVLAIVDELKRRHRFDRSPRAVTARFLHEGAHYLITYKAGDVEVTLWDHRERLERAFKELRAAF